MKTVNNGQSVSSVHENHPVWAIGFRPFFLSGALLSIGLIFYLSFAYFKGLLPDILLFC